MPVYGEIDLMSGVSYTEERAGQMLFATPGAERYYVCVSTERIR